MNLNSAVFGVVDVETTGFEKETDRVVECALIPTSAGSSLLGWEGLFNPGIPIPPEASAIHHITDADVAGRGAFLDVPADEFKADVFAAHFAEFDGGFIPQISGKPIVCTYRLARHLWPTLDQYGNQYLRYLHRLEIDDAVKSRPMHRAYPDAYVTSKLLRFELAILADLRPEIETVDQLIEWITGPFLLYRITFGKYGPRGADNPGPKGKLWSEVPAGYLRWLDEQWRKAEDKGETPETDVDTMFTCRYYLNAK